MGSCKVVFFCLAKEISLWKHNCCCVKVKVGPQTTEGRLFFFFFSQCNVIFFMSVKEIMFNANNTNLAEALLGVCLH